MKDFRHTLATLLLGCAAPAFAQVAQHQPAPVDQAVGDLGPLSTSFRRVEPGLGLFNRATALRPVDQGDWQRRGDVPVDPLTGLPMPQGFVYTGPGFRAYLPQAEYVVRSRTDPTQLDRNMTPANDGEYILTPPANMVYDLVYRAEHRATPTLNPAAVDGRLDTRIDARLPARPSGGPMGNIDYTGGVVHRSPQQALLELYRREDRRVLSGENVERADDKFAEPRTAGTGRAADRRSGAEQQVVEEADAAEPRRDQRDDAAGE